MKPHALARLTGLVLAAVAATTALAAAGSTFTPATFKVPFEFQAGASKKIPAGQYTVSKAADTLLVLRRDSTGKEIQVKVLEKIAQPAPPVTEAQLIFDEVGDFAPSYTEYFTVYVLAEVWLPGEGGVRVHVTKGAHKTRVVKAEER